MAHGHGESKYKPGEVAWGADHHILPVFLYFKVFVVLAILMGATIWASFIPFWGGTLTNNLIALAIAIIKASLVIAFFMHVKFTTPVVKLYALGGFVWFLTMFAILFDYWTRPIDPQQAHGWMQDPGSALPHRPKQPTYDKSDNLNINVRPRS